MIGKRNNGPVIRERAKHKLSRKHIDPDALKVLYRLNRAGFTAYLVGGGVRDLLLGKTPKDFDVSTDAHPNEIKRLFRNCFLIGRRFRLAHIRFGQKIIETSTFRRQPDEEDAVDIDMRGALVQHHDNTFGTPEEDAFRRDFTVNGLFYNIGDYSIIDYVGGLEDLDKGIIRSIGDPNVRFREDPVRMIRAVRFAARLGFKIDRDSLRAIRKHGAELAHCAPARLYEEVAKIFSHHSAEAGIRLLWQTGLMKALIPKLDRYINRNGRKKCRIFDYLAAYDAQEKFVSDDENALRFAVLIYPVFADPVKAAEEQQEHVNHAEHAREALQPLVEGLKMPRKQMFVAMHALDAQRRFEQQNKRFKKSKFVRQESFPCAIDLRKIVLTAENGNPQELRPWLDLYKQAGNQQKSGGEASRQQDGRKRGGRSRNRRRRPRRSSSGQGEAKPRQG